MLYEQNPTPKSPHITFGALPRPNHSTGFISFLAPPSPPFRLRGPCYGKIAQRRVQTRDQRGDLSALEAFLDWHADNPEDEIPMWNKVEWTPEPHPGDRVLVLIEDEVVSPSTELLTPFGSKRLTSDGESFEADDARGVAVRSLVRTLSTASTVSSHHGIGCCKVQ